MNQEQNPNKTEQKQKDEKGRFLPGNKCSPGRPKKELSLISLLKDELETEQPNGKTLAQNIMSKLTELANKGDRKAIETILHEIHGMPKQRVEHSGEINSSKIYKLKFGNSKDDPQEETEE